MVVLLKAKAVRCVYPCILGVKLREGTMHEVWTPNNDPETAEVSLYCSYHYERRDSPCSHEMLATND
jgi:hypothetical protein